MVCAEIPMGSKLHFPQWKIYFCQFFFIDKYLKFKKIDSSIIAQACLCTFCLFSTVKLKLGHNFCQFILKSKTGIFECGLRLYFELFFNS